MDENEREIARVIQQIDVEHEAEQGSLLSLEHKEVH